ncbi:YbaB/EbfC family nucleoid-associated protein [Gordonia sp. CPCC 205515]|uniref:YbaB/EbfC family nucleoid-associated protein n=1 Tax=Gordonia sp. CPCC 205515 TaxID=3140791 RepID=UPI003AF39F5A
MDFPRTADDIEPLLGTMNSLLSDIASTRTKAIELTATASELDGRVQVSVNARGIVTETILDEDALTTLTPQRLGAAITAAAQAAAQEVNARTQELWAPITAKQQSLPRASQIFDGLPDIAAKLADRPEPALTPPTRTAPAAADDDMYYEDIEAHTNTVDDEPHFEYAREPEQRRDSFTDRAW